MPGLYHGFGFSRRQQFIFDPPDLGVQYGQQRGHYAGEDGTMFVDGVGGDDANDGLTIGTAKKTLGAAVSAASAIGGDQVVQLVGNGVKYREGLDFIYSNPALTSLAIKGYGTDRPIISGAEVLEGWSACDASDSAVVGSNWPNVYRVTVNAADVPSPRYWQTIVAEAGEALEICGLREPGRTVPDFFIDNIDQCFDAADPEETTNLAFGLRSGVWYDTISHPEQLGSYSDSQLEQTCAVVHAFPNVTGFMEVESVSSGVLQLKTANLRPAGGGTNGGYALLNLLPNIARGQWGYRANGDGTVTFYCWPNDPSNLAEGIEIAVRTEGMRIYRSISNAVFHLEGVDFEMFAGGGARNQAFGFDGLTSGLTGNTGSVKQCRFALFSGGSGMQAKFAGQGITVEHCTFENGVGFGMSTVPSVGANIYLFDYRIRNCLAQDLSQTGFRMFGIRDAVLSDIRSYRTSGGGHANSINFYQGCDRVVCVNVGMGFGSDDRIYLGYATNQTSSRLYFLHCIFTAGDDSRGYVDQTVPGEALPVPGGGGHLLNCWVPHRADIALTVNNGGITVGRDVMDWSIFNCVSPAIVNTGGSLTRKGNVLTGSDTTADLSETLVDVSDLHADIANRDYAPTENSILNSNQGVSVEATILTLEGWFPAEDFRRDALGRPWNPASPGTGPFGKSWDI